MTEKEIFMCNSELIQSEIAPIIRRYEDKLLGMEDAFDYALNAIRKRIAN